MAELTGQTFAGFEVVAKLGQGGMGAVYKARQPLLDRFVALKVMSQQLSSDPAYVARFIREAASAAKLNHPNMVQVHTAGEQGGVYYIVMEFVEGESLSQRLKRAGALDPAEAIAITLHVATALQCAWNEARLIHRDIKPDNIFLSRKGEVKVGDLGLAKSVSGGATEMTQSGMMMGSPHYISPEQARASKETDFRADIYSLGCTLYQLLTGMTPYQADEALAVVLKHVTDPTPDIRAVMPACPQVLAALVGKMMAKDPNQRHASYEELMAELWWASDIVQQQQSAATVALTPAAAKAPTVVPIVKQTAAGESKPVIRNSRFVMGGAIAAAAVLLVGLFLWSPWKSRTDEQGRREDAKIGSESRLQVESVATQPAKAGTPNLASSAAALKLLGNVYTNAVGAEMVYIPPGEFMLGSTKEEQEWALTNKCKEEYVKCEGTAPRKAMIKQGFWMGRTEVTVGQWKQFVKETAYVTDAEKKGESIVQPTSGGPYGPMKGKSWRDPNFGFELKDNHPVTCVSWNDAKSFCEWLQRREQQAGRVARGYTVRLPTEAEWEYACRAGRATRFWWGDSVEDGRDRLNWAGTTDGFRQVAPVDSYGDRGRNGFGLADMQGNISEWCMDEFDATQAHDDLWKGDHVARVLRGGAFVCNPASCRSAFRFGSPPPTPISNCGFRVCYGVEVSGAEDSTSPNSSEAAPKDSGILAPPETRVTALTTTPKVGEVYTLPLGSNVTMELMGIPPGEFMMGSTKEEQAWATANGDAIAIREGEKPRRTVVRHPFWMGRTELTVGQWKQFVNATNYQTDAEKKGGARTFLIPGVLNSYSTAENPVKGSSWRNPNFGFPIQDNHPVVCISWSDAAAFCAWLTGREQAAGRLPAGYRIRLPTEAEWEYACRGGRYGTKFWWGDSPQEAFIRSNTKSDEDGFPLIAPVDHYGTQGRNGYGLADMTGNVQEYCLDNIDFKGAHEEFFTRLPIDPSARGATFALTVYAARCAAARHSVGKPTYCSSCVQGVRICCGVEPHLATGKADSGPTAEGDKPAASAITAPPAEPSKSAPPESSILTPPETRVAALTTTPKVGEVYTLPLGSNVTMELMGIPPGEFMMGSTKEEQAWAVANRAAEEYVKPEGEAPRKTTIKQGFWLGRTEVTIGQWKQFVKDAGYISDAEKKGKTDWVPGNLATGTKGKSWRDPGFGSVPQDRDAVCCVSWNDAKAFCEWLGGRERRAGRLPQSYEIRLPMEVEWEYACRAGTQTKFWWGESEDDGKNRLNWAGKEDGFEIVAPVDSYGARGRNGFGLADMLGNVYEWCLDGFDATQAHEDLWTGNPSARVLRGGAFNPGIAPCRCAHRRSRKSAGSDSHDGFRVAVAPAR